MSVGGRINYFTDPAFLSFDNRAGILRSRGGTRMLGVSEDFLRGFVDACEYETGQATPGILRRCGSSSADGSRCGSSASCRSTRAYRCGSGR